MRDEAQYGTEVATPLARQRMTDAARSRPTFNHAPKVPEQEKRLEQMRQNRVFVRGRFRPDGRRVFDVIKMDGGKWSLYATNCMWVEQALEFADSCLSGRTTVSLSNARALLVPDRRTGLYVPDRKLDPRHAPTQLKPLDGKALHESGLIEVSRETKKAAP